MCSEPDHKLTSHLDNASISLNTKAASAASPRAPSLREYLSNVLPSIGVQQLHSTNLSLSSCPKSERYLAAWALSPYKIKIALIGEVGFKTSPVSGTHQGKVQSQLGFSLFWPAHLVQPTDHFHQKPSPGSFAAIASGHKNYCYLQPKVFPLTQLEFRL